MFSLKSRRKHASVLPVEFYLRLFEHWILSREGLCGSLLVEEILQPLRQLKCFLYFAVMHANVIAHYAWSMDGTFKILNVLYICWVEWLYTVDGSNVWSLRPPPSAFLSEKPYFDNWRWIGVQWKNCTEIWVLIQRNLARFLDIQTFLAWNVHLWPESFPLWIISCDVCDNSVTSWGNFFNFDRHVHSDWRMNGLDFGGQRSLFLVITQREI